VIAIELRKQLGRPRTYLTYGALAAFSVALTVALQLTGASQSERVGDIPLYLVPGTSGLTVSVIALASTMKFFLPLAVAIFAGECVAGEASWGSLRYVLVRPVSRGRFLGSKLLVAALFSVVAVALVPLAALAAGTAVFGWHPLTVVDGSASTLAHTVSLRYGQGEALRRLGLSTAYVAAGMASILAFSFFLSTLTTAPFLAVAGGVFLTILSRVLNADYLPGVAVLAPYLPNNDVDLWQHYFQQPMQTDGMQNFLVLQVVYAGLFLGLAWWRFLRQDVLS
jgi:ABC-2 type transport system permease protein